MASIGILFLIFIIAVCLIVRLKQSLLAEYFEGQPEIFDNGNVNVSMSLPKYSFNANLLIKNGTITATYNVVEKETNNTYNNYQIFSQNLIIKDGKKYYVASSLQPQAIYELSFDFKKITKNVIAENEYDRIFNAINNYIKKDVNLVGPNMDVAPMSGFNQVEQPAKVPTNNEIPKPTKNKKNILSDNSVRVDKPDKNKLLDINYYNNNSEYIQLDNNRNMMSDNKEGVTYRTVCDGGMKSQPAVVAQPVVVSTSVPVQKIKPKKDMVYAEKVYYKNQFNNIAQKMQEQCVQFMELKKLMSNV